MFLLNHPDLTAISMKNRSSIPLPLRGRFTVLLFVVDPFSKISDCVRKTTGQSFSLSLLMTEKLSFFVLRFPIEELIIPEGLVSALVFPLSSQQPNFNFSEAMMAATFYSDNLQSVLTWKN